MNLFEEAPPIANIIVYIVLIVIIFALFTWIDYLQNKKNKLKNTDRILYANLVRLGGLSLNIFLPNKYTFLINLLILDMLDCRVMMNNYKTLLTNCSGNYDYESRDKIYDMLARLQNVIFYPSPIMIGATLYRMIGESIYLITQNIKSLMFFPSLIEPVFATHLYFNDNIKIFGILVGMKLYQEFVLHYINWNKSKLK